MKLTFQMTADDYIAGWKQKNKFNRKSTAFGLFISLVMSIIIAVVSIVTSSYFGFLVLAFVLFLPFFNVTMEYKLRRSEFSQSPILNNQNTVNVLEGGLEILGSFQKIFVPFSAIYKIVNTEKYFVIMPTFSGNIFSINKETYKGTELDEIMLKIKSSLPPEVFKEGK